MPSMVGRVYENSMPRVTRPRDLVRFAYQTPMGGVEAGTCETTNSDCDSRHASISKPAWYSMRFSTLSQLYYG